MRTLPDKKIYRVQVKWVESSGKTGLPVTSLRRSGSKDGSKERYQKGDFDFIIGYDLFTDTCYVWSWGEVVHLKSTVSICLEAAERWDKFWL